MLLERGEGKTPAEDLQKNRTRNKKGRVQVDFRMLAMPSARKAGKDVEPGQLPYQSEGNGKNPGGDSAKRGRRDGGDSD